MYIVFCSLSSKESFLLDLYLFLVYFTLVAICYTVFAFSEFSFVA